MERRDDVVGAERRLGQEEEGVDLADGAVDPPAGAHLSEMQDELLLDLAWHPELSRVSEISETDVARCSRSQKGATGCAAPTVSRGQPEAATQSAMEVASEVRSVS
jgi:hypothetical protein